MVYTVRCCLKTEREGGIRPLLEMSEIQIPDVPILTRGIWVLKAISLNLVFLSENVYRKNSLPVQPLVGCMDTHNALGTLPGTVSTQ